MRTSGSAPESVACDVRHRFKYYIGKTISQDISEVRELNTSFSLKLSLFLGVC